MTSGGGNRSAPPPAEAAHAEEARARCGGSRSSGSLTSEGWDGAERQVVGRPGRPEKEEESGIGGSSKSGTAKVDAFKLAALKLFDFMVSELPGVPGDAL
jgi:hypothetical protein